MTKGMKKIIPHMGQLKFIIANKVIRVIEEFAK
jgi:hypothetical protein